MRSYLRINCLFVFTVFLYITPSSSFAQGCDCGTMSHIMNDVSQKMIKGITQGITPPLSEKITEAAQYTTSTLHTDLVGLREAILFTKDHLAAEIKAADERDFQRTKERTYEPASQPESNCGNNQMGGGYQSSKGVREKASVDIMEKVYERKKRFERPIDYRNELAADDWPTAEKVVDHLGIMASGKTLTLDELKEAQQIIEAITNPLPPQQLIDSKKETLDGKTYEVMLKNYETKQALFQSVIADHLARRAPTVDGLTDWVKGKWGDMGGQGTPPGLIDGKLSQDALFWILSNMRLASANWHEEILPQLPEAGLLRDIASMQATQLELSRRTNELLESLVLMTAMDGLDRLDTSERHALREQYNRVIGTDQK